MTSNESRNRVDFRALSSASSSLNTVSNELTKVVGTLDEGLGRLNIGLTAWVPFQFREWDGSPVDHDEIGYTKVNGRWGIALRRVWAGEDPDIVNIDGPWLFNDAPRDMRLASVDAIPKVIEALHKDAINTAKRIQEKTKKVREFADAVKAAADPVSEHLVALSTLAGKPTVGGK